MIFALVALFGAQTWFVYSDPTGRRTPPLSSLAARGQDVWHRYNCQSCHQIYGFGGFLGPDLTNAGARLSQDRIDQILTDGVGQMPAFHLSVEERDAFAQFLRELDKTGVGQAKAVRKPPAGEVFKNAVLEQAEKATFSQAQQRGFDLVLQKGCVDCHLPNPASRYLAAELSRLPQSPGREGVLFVLMDGRPERGMPRFNMDLRDREAVYEFLLWLSRHGSPVAEAFAQTGSGDASPLAQMPWFEFE